MLGTASLLLRGAPTTPTVGAPPLLLLAVVLGALFDALRSLPLFFLADTCYIGHSLALILLSGPGSIKPSKQVHTVYRMKNDIYRI